MFLSIVSSLFSKATKANKQKDKQINTWWIGLSVALATMHAQALTITTSIPPVAGIIAPLLDSEDQLSVILKPGKSPHDFQMTPANMQQLAKSDLVIWVGTPIDAWLEKPLQATNAKQFAMNELQGLHTLAVRSGGLWEKHDHSHEEHGHNEHNEHNHNEYKHDEHGHDEHEHHMSYDGHLWMSYENAVLLVKATSKKLQAIKPQHKTEIQQREATWLKKLQQTDESLKKQLQPIKEQPYLVLHDAFQYFEARYALSGIGSIVLNPTISPSLKRVAEMRLKIKQGEVKCVFKEPQFPEKRVVPVIRGLDVGLGTIDPIGVLSNNRGVNTGLNTELGAGSGSYMLYHDFMQQLADQFTACLAPR